MSSADWLNVMAQEDAARRKKIDDRNALMWEQYVKSQQWAKDMRAEQMRREEAERKDQIEIYKEKRQAERDARADAKSERDYAARYVEQERSMIYKNVEILKGLNQAYWNAVGKEGRDKVDARMAQAQAVNAATVQALDLYQGMYSNQQVNDPSQGSLTAEHGMYSHPNWRSIQTQLKNDPVMIEQVKTNLVNYARLPAEARQAEREKYVHDLQLSKGTSNLVRGTMTPEESQARLEQQTHYLLQQLPAMPPPAGYGAPSGASPEGPSQPAAIPEANVPRAAFGGYMTVTDEDGKKRSYMVPTEDADEGVRQAMDMYNNEPDAQPDAEFDDWFTAKQSFNDFLNSPYDDYIDDTPKPPASKGLQFSREPSRTPVMPGPL